MMKKKTKVFWLTAAALVFLTGAAVPPAMAYFTTYVEAEGGYSITLGNETTIEEKVENPTFFVFSNDMDWVKKNIQINSRVFYIDINSGNGSYKDMQLMSNCKHNIIANSSFSWWGAWLNENKNKIVIAPKKWINREDVDSDKIELFCEGWTLL